ncbi:MAG: ATP-dependent 6-phosphofructokinase [Roseiflexus castenholzii]|jgi:6-phosphofructokinase 1|uniref:6-phosphofructokinase n=1 Tax=Roseiflexus castenholzii (strain DSM 13941 / HLO8) TaxID=383372 RepID=A7NM38_ROSCS|nr:ATP-dependent 6-phosphofructokinase [Roseiflexus castenholzii]ABU58593.1 6-phosphofructokinase [Roseiflexus castenholzii DSM 13941]PMP79034.1 MAG: ATP-dependent 6-phosphofructokinase [Roseiflexus castenholzii]
MRIGILTGGGDVPGLNPCIKAVVNRANDAGIEVIGIRRGWAGLLYYNPDDPESASEWVQPLTKADVRTIDRYGGTHLHTSRTNPQKVREKDMPEFLKGRFEFSGEKKTADCTPHVLRVLEHLGIDTLVPIGGDDTLSYAVRMHREGVRVIAIPKTMDNDVFGTDYCIGFSTAVTRSVDFLNALRTPTGSHERIAVIELFGRNSGETALISAYLADVDRAVISEVPFDVEKLARFLVEDRKRNPSNYSICVISEGASMIGGQVVEYGQEDAYGHRKLGGIGMITGEAIKKITGIDIVYQQLSYLMRAGAPDSLDRMVAICYGNLAVDQLLQGHSGRMVALQNGQYTTVPVDTCVQGVKRVDVEELYDTENYRPRVKHPLGKPMFLY